MDILITKDDKGNGAATELFRKNLRCLAAKCPNPIFFDCFRTANPTTSYSYGLPKIHKEGVHLRPISSCNSVVRPLDSWLASVLSPFMGSSSGSYINAMDFMEKVRSLATHGETLVSFDVDSFCTKITLGDVLDFLEKFFLRLLKRALFRLADLWSSFVRHE